MPRFEIVLDRPTRQARVYYPGEEVSGAVTIQSGKPKRYCAIRVSLIGRTEVSWQEGLFIGSGSYHAADNFLNLSAAVWTSGPNGVTQLPSGRHDFPFHFLLPLDVPPSLDETLGYVSYTLQAVIETPRFSFDLEVEKSIEVASLPSPLVDMELLRAVHKREHSVGGLFMCRSKLTVVDASLPKRVFSIGECLPVSVSVLADKARKERFLLTAALIKKVSFSAHRVVAREEMILSLVQAHTEHQNSNATRGMLWSPNGLSVPASLLPSTRTPHKLIDISYLVRVTISSKWRPDVSTDIPIVIGLPCHPCFNYTPPPSYSEAIKMT